MYIMARSVYHVVQVFTVLLGVNNIINTSLLQGIMRLRLNIFSFPKSFLLPVVFHIHLLSMKELLSEDQCCTKGFGPCPDTESCKYKCISSDYGYIEGQMGQAFISFSFNSALKQFHFHSSI